MIEVAFESSTRPGSVAARRAEEVVSSVLDTGRAHASDLLPALSELLKQLGAVPSDIGTIFVGLGPGSFTGLRVAIATAQGLARATSARMCGLSSLRAHCEERMQADGELGVLLDARAGGLYFAHYERKAGTFHERCEPRVIDAASAKDLIAEDLPLIGDGQHLQRIGFETLSAAYAPRAAEILRAGSRQLELHGPQMPEQLEPLYLRPVQARVRKR